MYVNADLKLVDLDLNSRSQKVTKSSNSGFLSIIRKQFDVIAQKLTRGYILTYVFIDMNLVDLDLNSRSPDVTKSSNSGFSIDN